MATARAGSIRVVDTYEPLERDTQSGRDLSILPKVASNVERVKSDPLVIPKKFLKYAAGETEVSATSEDFYLHGE